MAVAPGLAFVISPPSRFTVPRVLHAKKSASVFAFISFLERRTGGLRSLDDFGGLRARPLEGGPRVGAERGDVAGEQSRAAVHYLDDTSLD